MKGSHLLVVSIAALVLILGACTSAKAALNPGAQPGESSTGQQADTTGNKTATPAGLATLTFYVPTVT